MKHALLLLAALLVRANVFAQSNDEELIQFERDRLAAFAKDDKPAFDRMVADDATFTHGFGEVFDKKQEMAVMRASTPDRPLPALTIEGAKVHRYGDAAVLTGSLVETAKDGRRELVLRFTNTYTKQNAQWRMVAGQLTTLSRERAIAKVDPKTFAAYVGQYKNPSGRLLTVSQDGDKLIVELGGEKLQLLPAAENQFFLKEADVLLVFVKDESGRVVKLINRRPNGDVVEEVKVKS